MLGTLCSFSYLGVYFARNVLSATTPNITQTTGLTEEYIGTVSSLFMIFYAAGQMINGIVGDRIKAKYMLSFGLILAGAANIAFPYFIENPTVAKLLYGLTGFFLSMIYAPMVKVVAENTEPHHTVRCSLGFTFASFMASPIVGVLASFYNWRAVFIMSTVILLIMGIVCYLTFTFFEKKGIVKYGQFESAKRVEGGVRLLIKNRIIRFSLLSMLIGIIRTSVVFWLPSYFVGALNYSAEASTAVFAVVTFIASFSTFLAVFVYERLKNNMELTMILSFIGSTLFFILAFFVRSPIANIVFVTIAIIAGKCSATMLYSKYCPSLRDTGMVSSATGFIDCVSYIASAAANIAFPIWASAIGWGALNLVWAGLMLLSLIIIVLKSNKTAAVRLRFSLLLF